MLVAGLLAISVTGLAAYLLKQPLLFPSLSPTVSTLFRRSLTKDASPRNVVVGTSWRSGTSSSASTASLAFFKRARRSRAAKKAKDQGQEGRRMLKSQDPQERYQGAIHVGQSGWYVAMAALLSVIWIAYPVNFFLSEQGLGVWGLNASSTIYTVADIIAKPIYGFILLGGVLAIERRAEKARNEPPERYETDVERARREAEEARREAQTARRELEAALAGDRRTRTTAEIEGPSQRPAAGERYYDVEERYGVEEDADPGADPVRVRRTPRA